MQTQSPLKLHLDHDTSSVSLIEALLARGFDVSRTPNAWMRGDADDEQQLLGATAQGRVIFTFNIQDFIPLAQKHHYHAGILLATQRGWTLSERIEALTRVLWETEAEEWRGAVRWLNDWRTR